MKRTILLMGSVAMLLATPTGALATEKTETAADCVSEIQAADAGASPPAAQAKDPRLAVPATGVPVYVPPNRGTTAHRIGGGTRGGALRS